MRNISSISGAPLPDPAHLLARALAGFDAVLSPTVPLVAPPIADVPADWRAALPGQWLVGLHVLVLPAPLLRHELPASVRGLLDEDSLVGARVMDDSAGVYTDFRLYGDGFARWIVLAGDMTPRRLGRLVQRLQEVETYRMMALLGLPLAREVGAALVGAERDLAEVAERIRLAQADDEPELLRQLTQLAARVEGLYARTHARFSASAAYFELVQRRIDELREERAHNLQTIREFMDRRLLPAMQTCASAGRRLQALSERVSRVSNLLRTRVEIEQQASSRELLDAMNRRQKAQLLLQSAVEGLSVAAVTYYGAGLVGYAAKGAKSLGWNVSPDLAVALAIPLIAGPSAIGSVNGMPSSTTSAPPSTRASRIADVWPGVGSPPVTNAAMTGRPLAKADAKRVIS